MYKIISLIVFAIPTNFNIPLKCLAIYKIFTESYPETRNGERNRDDGHYGNPQISNHTGVN